MKFVDNTSVYTKDDQKVGTIDRVVIDPATQEVSHLVVEKGFFFPENKVIPVSAVANADADRVILKKTKNDLELPPFEETDYVPLHEIDSETDYDPIYRYPMYAYPPVGTTAMWGTGWYYNPDLDTTAVEVTDRNVPEDAVALKEGANVYSSDDEHVGEIDSVITRDDSNQVTHFVVAQGFLFETNKLIPVFWIERTNEENVYLGVHSDTLRDLPEYEYEAEKA